MNWEEEGGRGEGKNFPLSVVWSYLLQVAKQKKAVHSKKKKRVPKMMSFLLFFLGGIREGEQANYVAIITFPHNSSQTTSLLLLKLCLFLLPPARTLIFFSKTIQTNKDSHVKKKKLSPSNLPKYKHTHFSLFEIFRNNENTNIYLKKKLQRLIAKRI